MLYKKLLDKTCFKIEKENAQAMIAGFNKDGKIVHQSVYCRVLNQFPNYRLITLNKHTSKFPLSSIGKNLNSQYFAIEHKYVVEIKKQYNIENVWDNVHFWNDVCTNGLFDIWEPIAPVMRFEGSVKNPKNFNIALLRIYEIENKFYDYEVESVSDRVDNLVTDNKYVSIKKPIIDDNEFKNIENKFENILLKFNHT